MYCEMTVTKVLWCFTFIVLVVLLILQIIDMHTVVKNHAHELTENSSSAVKTGNSIKISIAENDKYELSFSDNEIQLTPIAE